MAINMLHHGVSCAKTGLAEKVNSGGQTDGRADKSPWFCRELELGSCVRRLLAPSLQLQGIQCPLGPSMAPT